jgi:nucleoside 2-deoxyribosyltransferase
MPLTDKRYLYAAGKIKIGHGASEYRAKIAPFLRKHGIHVLDPLRGKYDMPVWHGVLVPNEVVVRDLQDINRAHVLLAVMMKYEDTSFGTPCEVMYAWERRIPVIMITNERYLADHFWTKSLCSHIFFVDEDAGETFDDVLMKAAEHIAHWYGTDVEQEVYNNPTIIQQPDPSPTPSDINPDDIEWVVEATTAAESLLRRNIVDGHCNTCDRSASECECLP